MPRASGPLENRDRKKVGICRSPKPLDKDVARLHLDGIDVRLTKLTKKRADQLGVPLEGICKAGPYRR